MSITTITIKFEDGRSYISSRFSNYKNCMKYYLNEKPLKLTTFYGKINNIEF